MYDITKKKIVWFYQFINNMITEKDYCDKELSATLIEMGFKGFGHFYYGKDSSKLKATHQFLTTRTAKALNLTLAVSLYEAQKWLREEKNIIVEVFIDDDSDTPITYNIYKDRECVCHHNGKYWSVKEWSEALLEGIKAAVKLLKEERK